MGSSAGFRWFGKQVSAEIDRKLHRRLSAVGEMLASAVRENISESTRSSGPSAPGEYPHADTGHLRKSITHEVDDEDRQEVRVGTNVIYGKFLEVDMDREMLQATLEDRWSIIKRMLTKPL